MPPQVFPPAIQRLGATPVYYLRHLLRPSCTRRLVFLFCGLLFIGRWSAADFRQTYTEENPIQMPSKSNFHFLVTTSARTRRNNLCRCLLSAAILDYPPPTLVNYERSLKLRRGRENVQEIYDFLTGKEVGESDIILVISEDAWVQLPPAVTISRFLHVKQKVLFGTVKQGTNLPVDPSSLAILQYPLPNNLYRKKTKIHDSKYRNARLLASDTVIGKVRDLIPVYKHALDLLRATDQERFESQQAMSQIFREQEASRVWMRGSWKGFFGRYERRRTTNTEVRNYDFGIGLDFESEIFQIADTDSEDDIKFLKNPIKLSLDLMSEPPWLEVQLATNTLATNTIGNRIPSVLGFKINKKDNSANISEEWWPKMWFYKHSRELMKNYLDSSGGMRAASAAESGGRAWWNMRGGRGGVWTGRGEWLAWKEVCGGVKGLYADGVGDLDEGSDEGIVRNSFGNVVEGNDGGNGLEELRFGGGGV